MSESQISKFTLLTESAQSLFEMPPEEFEESEYLPPEVLSPEDLKQRIEAFQNSFYIDPDKLKFRSIEVCNTPFTTISRENKNMAIGTRFTGAFTQSRENLIDPNSVTPRGETRAFYVNHDDGYAGFMACMSTDISLEDSERWQDVEYVEGEVLVSFSPGDDVISLSFDDHGKRKTFGNRSITITCIEPHRLQFTVEPESLTGYDIVAYDDQGRMLDVDWARYPVFKGDKLAKDFSEDAPPTKEMLAHYVYCAHFKGLATKIDVYFSKPTEKHWLPIKTPRRLLEPDWDDFKTISTGPSYVSPEIVYLEYSQDKLKEQIQCEFTRSEAMMELNKPEISVSLPDSHNSNLAEIRFDNVRIHQPYASESFELKYFYGTRCISSFSLESDDHDSDTMQVEPGKTRFTGNVTVMYPTHMEWVKFTRESSSTEDGHKIDFNGSYLEYSVPEAYKRFEMRESMISHFFKAFDKSGHQLKILKSTPFPYRDVPFKLGVWGPVDHIEVAICRQWATIEKEFELVAGGDLENNPAEDMLNTLTNMLSGED